MANLTITAASVGIGSTAKISQIPLLAGEALTQGCMAYFKTADKKWFKTDANLSQEASGYGTRSVFVVTPAAGDGSYFLGIEKGPVIVGATLTQGETYALSRTAGLICPIADLTTGDYPTSLGVATNSTTLDLNIQPSGVVK